MTDREALQQALEALEEAREKADWIGMSEEGWDKVMQQVDEYVAHRINPAITALRERLAQPEQEPVAWRAKNAAPPGGHVIFQQYPQAVADLGGEIEPLYTAPPQRKPLFKEFIQWADSQGYDCAHTCNSDTGEWIALNPMTADLWKAWQAAHGNKGEA